MEISKMKNMVILKNLPSNLVEEAIVILKSNKKAKKLEKIDKKEKKEKIIERRKEKDYIVKEAEMLVSSYISKIEDYEKQKQYKINKVNKKYFKLKKYAIMSSMVIILETMALFIK